MLAGAAPASIPCTQGSTPGLGVRTLASLTEKQTGHWSVPSGKADSFGRIVKETDTGLLGCGTKTNGYDAAGNVISRTWFTGKTQILTNLSAGTPKVIDSTYDPLVEFLEIGATVGGQKTWKVYGPDLNGEFGSLQGTGGLEAVIVEGAAATGIINDFWGNAVGSVSGGSVTWNATRVAGYGPLPGTEAKLLANATDTVESTLWRGKRLDPTGFYYLGARYYEPGSGRFLSTDPAGHASSMSLYDYANGDPINLYDPDGRVAIGFASGLTLGSFSKPQNLTQAIAGMVGQVTSYFVPGFGQAAIVRDSAYSAYSAANRISDISQNGFTAGKGFGLGMDVLGSLPVAGTTVKVATRIESTVVSGGGRFLPGALERGSVNIGLSFGSGAAKASPSVPAAGEDLFIGLYGQSRRANIQSGLNATHTPHHVVQNTVSDTSHSLGVTINMRKDLHQLTRSYGRNADLGNNVSNLAADVWDLRSILRGAGYDRSLVNQEMRALIDLNRKAGNVP